MSFALANALKEHAQGESAPLSCQVKTVTIPGSGIANNGPVAGIFEYAAATVDLTIAVEVGIHDVARAPAISKIILIGICQVSIHLFLGPGDACCRIAPDLSHFPAIVPGTDIAGLIGITDNFQNGRASGRERECQYV